MVETGRRSFLRGLALGFLISSIISSTITINSNYMKIPKQAYKTGDLNKDGIEDLLIETMRGTKIPLYQVEGSEGTYLSGLEIIKKDPESIINYESIAVKLNKQ